ncbi:hypothetical protein [Streptomyces sp. NPDC060184]|uniref:hypothetical protein n=1 Tax=Streptomyces sp. NPDC060184 TaxID=3347064 RepID=UPI00365B1E0A
MHYQRLGVADERLRTYVKPPTADEPLDPGRRPIDLSLDSFEDGTTPPVRLRTPAPP